jgi:hypothetical protein
LADLPCVLTSTRIMPVVKGHTVVPSKPGTAVVVGHTVTEPASTVRHSRQAGQGRRERLRVQRFH